jgi:UDP-hydrolysing UDP-N-acetyl-D-glucosamine 2-epimerase
MKLFIPTGSRADYGHLSCLLRKLERSADFDYQLIATGTHLSARHGQTVDQIVQDGFRLHAKIPIPIEDSSGLGISRAMSAALQGFAQELSRGRPDAVVVYGDRFEMMAAAIAALFVALPVVHIGGGDVSEGSYDDAIRHGITKIARLHFTTNAESSRRVIQMGEAEDAVYTAGSLAIDAIRGTALFAREELEQSIGFKFRDKNLLVTYLPVTQYTDPLGELEELLVALSQCGDDVGILVTLPSLDHGSNAVANRLERFVGSRPNRVLVPTLGARRYYSAISVCDVVVGNSSSGLYEVPSFQKPTVNVGSRQQGRLRPSSVIDALPDRASIAEAVTRAFEMDCRDVVNPYGDGHAAERIVSGLSTGRALLNERVKRFYMI